MLTLHYGDVCSTPITIKISVLHRIARAKNKVKVLVKILIFFRFCVLISPVAFNP